ncbi:MAG: hypothetical protein Q8Q01_04425 [archaeon]|nr:hypothetical protein [archaeon]
MEMNTYTVKTDRNGNIAYLAYLDSRIPFTGHPEYEESEGLNLLLRNNPFSTQRFNLRFEPDYTGDRTLVDIKDSYSDDTLDMKYVAGIRALKAKIAENDARVNINSLIEETLAELEDATEKNKPYRVTANNDKVYEVTEVTDDMIIKSEYIPQAVPEAYGNKDENYFLIPLREGEVGDVPYAVVEAVESDEVIELSLDDLIFDDNTETNQVRNPASQYEVDVDLDDNSSVTYNESAEWEEWNAIINNVPIDNEDDTLRNSRPIPTVVKYLDQVQEPTTKYGRDTKHYDDDKLVAYNPIDTRMEPEESIIIEESFRPTQIIRNPLPNEKVSLIDRLKGMGKRYFTGRK